jgi:hypothetical protein
MKRGEGERRKRRKKKRTNEIIYRQAIQTVKRV